MADHDPVNSPTHYATHPSGIECWQISAHLPHPMASAFEYVFRHRDKGQPVADLHERLRDVRVTCGDWSRVVKESVTVRHGITGLFLDPPYALGEMDYSAGGMGLGIAEKVRKWCAQNGACSDLRIVLCGHRGEHDELLQAGWTARKWTARKGYALTDEAIENSAGETIWCSPHCVPEMVMQRDLFGAAA